MGGFRFSYCRHDSLLRTYASVGKKEINPETRAKRKKIGEQFGVASEFKILSSLRQKSPVFRFSFLSPSVPVLPLCSRRGTPWIGLRYARYPTHIFTGSCHRYQAATELTREISLPEVRRSLPTLFTLCTSTAQSPRKLTRVGNWQPKQNDSYQ